MERVILRSGIICANFAVLSLIGSGALQAKTTGPFKCGLLKQGVYDNACNVVVDSGKVSVLDSNGNVEKITALSAKYVGFMSPEAMGINMKNNAEVSRIRQYAPRWINGALKEPGKNIVVQYLNSQGLAETLLISEDSAGAHQNLSLIARALKIPVGKYRSLKVSDINRLTYEMQRSIARDSQRVAGFCSARMFDEASNIADLLDVKLYNALVELSLFSSAKSVSSKIDKQVDSAYTYCNDQRYQEIEEAKELERQRIEAIKRAERLARQREIAARNARIALEQAKRDEQWHSIPVVIQ